MKAWYIITFKNNQPEKKKKKKKKKKTEKKADDSHEMSNLIFSHINKSYNGLIPVLRQMWLIVKVSHLGFVCFEVLRPSQPSGVMSSAVSLPNHTFTGQA